MFYSTSLHRSIPWSNCPRRVLAQTAKPEEAPQRSPRIREENFAAAEKNLNFSRTRLAKDCWKVRKGLPKLRWGLNKSTPFYKKSAGAALVKTFTSIKISYIFILLSRLLWISLEVGVSRNTQTIVDRLKWNWSLWNLHVTWFSISWSPKINYLGNKTKKLTMKLWKIIIFM